jgi:hypothetical protein
MKTLLKEVLMTFAVTVTVLIIIALLIPVVMSLLSVPAATSFFVRCVLNVFGV